VTRRLLAIALVLTIAHGLRVWLDHADPAPPVPRLERLAQKIGNWQTVRDEQLSPEILGILRVDRVLVRDYEIAPGARVQLFIAYYREQHAGESMHSPRICLPGSGWEPVSISRLKADMGTGRREEVNRYLVSKDGRQMLVVYWYQGHERIVADEYAGKFRLMLDSMRRKRRDGAIVRVSLPVGGGLSESQATEQAAQFIQAAAPEITRTLFE
jgi:EpsI family protein